MPSQTKPGETAPSSPNGLWDAATAGRRLNATERWARDEAARYQRAVRMGQSTEGLLPCIKVGKFLRFDPRDVEAYIDAHRGR